MLFFVFSLLGVAKTAVLAISTPQSGDNYYSQLMELKDEWENPLFDSYKISLTCQKCEAAKVACLHRLHLNPVWKPPDLMRKQDAIMACRPDMREMETRGGIPKSKGHLLSKEQIAFMQAQPRMKIMPGVVKVVYVSIDPAVGGSSDWVVMSWAYVEMCPVVRQKLRSGCERHSGSRGRLLPVCFPAAQPLYWAAHP